MNSNNCKTYNFKVEFYAGHNSIVKNVLLSGEETANLYRWTFRLPLSAEVHLNEITEAEFDSMCDELAYQYLYCYLGDDDATFNASLLEEWISDCWGE